MRFAAAGPHSGACDSASQGRRSRWKGHTVTSVKLNPVRQCEAKCQRLCSRLEIEIFFFFFLICKVFSCFMALDQPCLTDKWLEIYYPPND